MADTVADNSLGKNSSSGFCVLGDKSHADRRRTLDNVGPCVKKGAEGVDGLSPISPMLWVRHREGSNPIVSIGSGAFSKLGEDSRRMACTASVDAENIGAQEAGGSGSGHTTRVLPQQLNAPYRFDLGGDAAVWIPVMSALFHAPPWCDGGLREGDRATLDARCGSLGVRGTPSCAHKDACGKGMSHETWVNMSESDRCLVDRTAAHSCALLALTEGLRGHPPSSQGPSLSRTFTSIPRR